MKKTHIDKSKKGTAENAESFIMTILDWVENKLLKRELFFDDFESAKDHCRHEKGKIKIYDHRRCLLHCEYGSGHDSYC